MRMLDRYVLREWLRIFLVVMLGFPLLVIVIDLTDKLGKYLSLGISRGAVALAYVYGMPDTMFLVLPAAVLFATVFTVGSLGRHAELTAAKASGISFYRLVRPIFFAGAAAFALGIGLGELVPIGAARRAELLGEKANRATSSRFNFVYRADGGWVYAIRSLEIATREMQDPILERVGTGPAYPTIVVTARRGRYASALGWTLQDGRVRYVLRPGVEQTFEFRALRTRVLRETPEELLAEPKAPEEMRYAELGRYIDALARSGSDVRKLTVDRALKLAIPFTCIVIALFGAPLAITSPRSGAAWGVAVSLATTFVFLLLMQLARAIGGGGLLPPTVSAWFPNALAALAAAWLLKRVQT
jgi:lipopolysaccharide export system permease protein